MIKSLNDMIKRQSETMEMKLTFKQMMNVNK